MLVGLESCAVSATQDNALLEKNRVISNRAVFSAQQTTLQAPHERVLVRANVLSARRLSSGSSPLPSYCDTLKPNVHSSA
jgi:hypothetical protein